MVVCFHMLWETFGSIMPIYRNIFTATLLDGELAVSIFFVLSGEALSVSFFSGKGRRGVVRLALKRYPRLVIPIFFASLLTLLIYSLGLVHNVHAGQIVKRPDWLQVFMRGDVDISRVIHFSLYGVFANRDPLDNLIPFLWTMRIELIGSVVVFAVLLVLAGTRIAWPLIATAIIILLILKGDFGQTACFLTGIVFAWMRLSGLFDSLGASRFGAVALSLMMLLVYVIDGYSHSYDTHRSLCAGFAIVSVLCFSVVPRLKKFMENEFSQFLGRISFPLFLVQYPVILSFSSLAIIYCEEEHLLREASFLIGLASVSVSVLVAMTFEPVEMFTKYFCETFADMILRRTYRATA